MTGVQTCALPISPGWPAGIGHVSGQSPMQFSLRVLRSAANVGRYEMTREEIQRVFSCLHRDGVRFVLVQGGEPLLRHDLP